MSHFLTLGANCKTLNFLSFFVIRVYYEKLGHVLKPLVLKFRPFLFIRLRDIAEKQVLMKLKPIVDERRRASSETLKCLFYLPSVLYMYAFSA